MDVSRIFVTTAVALSVLAAVGCASQTPRETAAAPVVFMAPEPVVIMVPEPVAVAAPMPADPIMVLAEPRPQVAMVNEPPLTMASADIITERAPRADRN